GAGAVGLGGAGGSSSGFSSASGGAAPASAGGAAPGATSDAGRNAWPGEGDGVGVGVGVGRGVGITVGGGQERWTPCATSDAARPEGDSGGAVTSKETSGVSVEGCPFETARATTRTVVPALGSGPGSTRVSPGATRRVVFCATFAKSPSTSARS